MRLLTAIAAMLVMLMPAVVSGNTKAYDVSPRGNCVAVAPPDADVIQYIRNVVDELTLVSFWVGDTIDTSSYNVVVADSAHPTHIVAYKYGKKATQCWSWLQFELTTNPAYELVRGRTYSVTVSRTSGTAISYAYDPTNPYKYGSLSVGGTAHPDWDLALRVTGLMRPVEATDWGATAQFLTLA